MKILAQLDRIELLSLLAYGLMLIPTILLLGYTADSGILVSRLIEDTWQATFWMLPGFSAKSTSVFADIILFLLIALAGWLFYRGYQCISSETTAGESDLTLAKRLLLWSALFALLLLAVVPFHSSDLYGYINRGAQQVYYQVNPYQVTVAGIPGWENDPMFHAHWIDNPCPYPFLFARLAQGLVMLSNHHFFSAFLGFKAIKLLAFLGSGYLIYAIARQLGQPRPALTLYLFAWNPLMLLHIIANGHNDILLIFFLLAAFRVLFSEKWAWTSLPLLMLSILIKYTSLLAAPFVLIFLVRNKQYRALWVGSLVALALLLVLGLPYVLTLTSVPASAMVENAGRAQHSIIAALSRVVYYMSLPFGLDAKAIMGTVQQLLKGVFLLGFLGFYLFQIRRFLQQKPDVSGVIEMTALVMTVLVLFVSAKFHSWYVIMFFPVALLLDEQNWLRRFGILVSLFHLIAFTPLQNLHILNVIILTLCPLYLVWHGWDQRWFKPALPVAPKQRHRL